MGDLESITREKYAAQYREEASERLAELEDALLDLESSPGDLDLIGKAFRAMHTIKGSAAMFAFDEIAAFTHEMETVFERVRSGALHATPALIRHALGGKDAIRAMLDGRGAETEADRRALVEALRAYSPRSLAPRPVPSKVTPAASPGLPSRTYRIGFRPAADLLQNGTNPLTLIDELRQDHGSSPYADQADLLAARSLVETSELGKAVERLTRVMKDSRDEQLHLVARLRLARVQLAQGNPDIAMATLDGAAAGAFAARFDEVRGDVLYAKGDKPGALRAWRKALEIDVDGSLDRPAVELKVADLLADGVADAAAAASSEAGAAPAGAPAQTPAASSEAGAAPVEAPAQTAAAAP